VTPHAADEDPRAGAGEAGVRAQLGATVISAAGPYGYTITFGGSTALASGRLGSPNLGEVLLLMLGAVTAFVLLELAARDALRAPADDRPPSIWGNAHVVSAGGALCLVWALLHVSSGAAMWAAVGLVATLAYFAGTAVQRVAVARLG